MLLFPLFILLIHYSCLTHTRSFNNSASLKHTRRPAAKVYDVEFVLRQAQNDDFDEPPPKSSVVYPSSAISNDDEADDFDPLEEEDLEDGTDGDKEIKRMPSRFYRRRFGNRYIRPNLPFINAGMGGGGMPPYGYGMHRPNGGGMGSMGGGDMGPSDSSDNSDGGYPMRFNYRRPFPMGPEPMMPRSGNGYNSYGPGGGNGNSNWFANNYNSYNGDGGDFYHNGFRGNPLINGGQGYGPNCGSMGCNRGGGGNNMMGQGMMRPPNSYVGGGYNGPMIGNMGGMGMGNGMWNGPMGSNFGSNGGGNDMGDGGNGIMGNGGGGMGMGGDDGPPTGAVGILMSNNGYSYAAYIERQVRSTTIMMYTLNGCVPCQRAKHLLAVHYADVKSHFLELAGGEDWQEQLKVDLNHITGAMTFPYIFVCGNYIGGSTDLIGLHQSGQLRRMVNSCSRKAVAAVAVAASA